MRSWIFNLKWISTFSLTGILAWACIQQQSQPDAGRSVAGKLISHDYIDPATCRPCHSEIVDQYLQTGKGRSFFSVQETHAMGNWNGKSVFDSSSNFHYQAQKLDSLLFIHEFRMEGTDTVHSRKEPAHFIIGSGNQTHSFLFQRNGYLFESPLTWYSRKGIWDLSPGYEKGGNFRFERPVGAECLSCHVSGYQYFEHSVNRYKTVGKALDCGSCHGPLADHLKNAQSGLAKKGDVLSIKAQPNQIQLDICRNCHLEGLKVKKENAPPGDFLPGKLLSQYFEIFIPADRNHEFGFASHAERLQMSACFQKSGGKLTCTSCHNPHQALPQNSDAFFNVKCQACHSEGHNQVCNFQAKSAARLDAKNCISCHISKSSTSDIPHVQSSDHWIRKRLQAETSSESSHKLRLSPFAGGKVSGRQTGLAYMAYAENFQDSLALKEVVQYLKHFSPEEQFKYLYLANQPYKPGLDTQVFKSTQDPTSLFYFAHLKKRAGLPWQATLSSAQSLAPFNIDLQYKIATELRGGKDSSLYASILSLDPCHVPSLSNLSFLKMEAGHTEEAYRLLRKAVSLNPDYSPALENLALYYFKSGKNSEARKILDRLVKKFPDEMRYRQILDLLP